MRDGNKRQSTAYHVKCEIKEYVDSYYEKVNPTKDPCKISKNNIAEDIFEMGIKEHKRKNK